MNASTIATDRVTAEAFLRALWTDPTSLPATAALNIYTQPERRSAWYGLDALEEAAQRANELAETTNVYAGCALVDLKARVDAAATERNTTAGRLDRATIRGTIDTALALPAGWLDVDVGNDGKAHKRTDLPPDVPTFLRFLEDAFPPPPSIVIDSGHGVQPWWLFDEPLVFETPEQREDAADLLLKVQWTIREKMKPHRWYLDSTHALSQVLRLPGTWNRKPGLPAVPVRVLRWEPDRRYSVETLERYLMDQGWSTGRIESVPLNLPAELPSVEINDLTMPPWIRDLAREGPAADPEHYSQRYIVMWRVIQELMECGHDDTTIAAILLDRRYKISEKAYEQRGAARKWIANQISKARAIHSTKMRIQFTTPTTGLVNGVSENGIAKHASAAVAERPAEPEPPEPIADERRHDPHRYGLTELGNAEVFVDQHGTEVRYVPLWKRWIEDVGPRWQIDTQEAVAERMRRTVRGRYAEAANAPTKALADAIGTWAKRSEGATCVKNSLWHARSFPGIPIGPEALDRDPWLYNCRNGTIDLRDSTLHAHDRQRLITKLTPVEYDPRAECPIFLEFLDRIMGGNRALIDFLQKSIGYSLTGLTVEQVLFLLYGLGANGKSTLLEILRELLGDYAQQAEFSTFLVSKHDRIRNDLARLRGARFVSAVEMESERRLSEAVVKQVTGGDTISARFLFSELFEFQPAFKLWLAANHKPEIRGTDHAIWRRIRLIPFNVTIPEVEQDKHLGTKLQSELPGILAWAVRGALAWQREGLGLPDEVREATAAYRAEQDTLGDFITERCSLEDGAHVLAADLFGAYREWCQANGNDPGNATAFALRLTERGITRLRLGKNRARGYGRIRLAIQDSFGGPDHD